jgi:hypothetical protein
MTTPEGKVKAKLKRFLDLLPSQYQFWPVQTGLGASTLDCLLCVNGSFVAIETKAKKGVMTHRQKLVRELIEAAGGIVYVVDDIDAADDFRWVMSQLRLLCRL